MSVDSATLSVSTSIPRSLSEHFRTVPECILTHSIPAARNPGGFVLPDTRAALPCPEGEHRVHEDHHPSTRYPRGAPPGLTRRPHRTPGRDVAHHLEPTHPQGAARGRPRHTGPPRAGTPTARGRLDHPGRRHADVALTRGAGAPAPALSSASRTHGAVVPKPVRTERLGARKQPRTEPPSANRPTEPAPCSERLAPHEATSLAPCADVSDAPRASRTVGG